MAKKKIDSINFDFNQKDIAIIAVGFNIWWQNNTLARNTHNKELGCQTIQRIAEKQSLRNIDILELTEMLNAVYHANLKSELISIMKSLIERISQTEYQAGIGKSWAKYWSAWFETSYRIQPSGQMQEIYVERRL